jgi:hypothetical protein
MGFIGAGSAVRGSLADFMQVLSLKFNELRGKQPSGANWHDDSESWR